MLVGEEGAAEFAVLGVADWEGEEEPKADEREAAAGPDAPPGRKAWCTYLTDSLSISSWISERRRLSYH